MGEDSSGSRRVKKSKWNIYTRLFTVVAFVYRCRVCQIQRKVISRHPRRFPLTVCIKNLLNSVKTNLACFYRCEYRNQHNGNVRGNINNKTALHTGCRHLIRIIQFSKDLLFRFSDVKYIVINDVIDDVIDVRHR